MTTPSIIAIAHRGASAEAPENTLTAFQRAIQLQASAIEFDLRVSADGQLVIMHDDTINRTTNARGPVAAMDWPTLSLLDAGTWFHPRFAGQRIPTLDDALRIISPAARPVIELKAPIDPAQFHEILHRHDRTDTAMTISFTPHWLAAIKQHHPKAPIGLLADEWHTNLIRTCQQLHSTLLVLSLNIINLQRVEETLDAGLEVWCYTANDVAIIAACAAMGITGIITDHPDLIRPK